MKTLKCWCTALVLLLGSVSRSSADLNDLEASLTSLARQAVMQQTYMEERTRTEGDSGIKQIRVDVDATKPYLTNTHAGSSVASIHEHSNNRLTMGMGEVVAVLNGVEFRTRHNDYKLVMPSRTSKQYRATQDIPLPEVPLSVSNKTSVAAQVEEMKEYFRAWHQQDTSIRNYKPFFKPVLCYMEGAWTKDVEKIQESFESDRHTLAAETWQELLEKIQFNGYTGTKDNQENQAFLPKAIFDVVNGTYPLLAQWNYRILCHPLKDDLPTDRFRVVEDLASRMTYKRTMASHTASRAARFQINPRRNGNFVDGRTSSSLLDELMYEVPGMNNYNSTLTDNAYGLQTLIANSKTLNAANYHRKFKVQQDDAMGQQFRHRGYSDQNLYVAMTTQNNIVGRTLRECQRQNRKQTCNNYAQKFTYAIPMEIIYLTPLSNWNPYNFVYHGNSNLNPTQGGRTGSSPEKALDGTSYTRFFWTPAEFFESDDDAHTADTSQGDVWVNDRSGTPRKVQASGHRIHLDIPGIGKLRQRYPIMPIHGEGSTAMKELSALTDLILNRDKFSFMYDTDTSGPTLPPPGPATPAPPAAKTLTLVMGPSYAATGAHVHRVFVNAHNYGLMLEKKWTQVLTTSLANGHQHRVRLRPISKTKVVLAWCDNQNDSCPDGHPSQMNRISP